MFPDETNSGLQLLFTTSNNPLKPRYNLAISKIPNQLIALNQEV